MRRGAFDYLPKPFTPDQLRVALDRVVRVRRLQSRVDTLEDQVREVLPEAELETVEPAFRRALDVAFKAAASEAAMLIRGESGTGKGVFARAVHARSPRAASPFVTVHCPSLSAELLESDLFGHAKGAFTGAVRDTTGKVAAAEGGTLFLDEIGDLPPALQPKLLRLLQDKQYERVGEARTRSGNVRILAATNRDLEQAVTEGAFRRDLYFRLNVLSLRIPPLRERREDISLLISHFMERACRASGQEKILSDEALKAMLAFDWPGNVRELENCLERTCAFTSGPLIHVPDLPPAIASTVMASAPHNGNGHHFSKIVPMAELEKQTILGAIAELNGDKLQAARLLGIGKTTLYRKLKDYAAQA
jgi:DNA-binding NtrC family response regulator